MYHHIPVIKIFTANGHGDGEVFKGKNYGNISGVTAKKCRVLHIRWFENRPTKETCE